MTKGTSFPTGHQHHQSWRFGGVRISAGFTLSSGYPCSLMSASVRVPPERQNQQEIYIERIIAGNWITLETGRQIQNL